ncbi:hypothetical protein BDV18DRAFT_88337 [Aspergillus unguis]
MVHMYKCQSCDAEFRYEDDCFAHMDQHGHWPECETCTRTFDTRRACTQHMDDNGHWAPRFDCESCSKSFRTPNAARQHMDMARHWAPKVPCETCNAMFYSHPEAEQHMRALSHFKHYCKDCKRPFDNENSLKMHLNSKTHRGGSITCPFCKAGYTAANGLSHHLETASCPKAPRLDREAIYCMVRARDPQGLITHKTIGWKDEENGSSAATAQTWNGTGYECYLCHREFTQLRWLNQHLDSNVHKQQVYHCPNGRCGKGFAAMAGLFNHLENEACAFMRFERVQKTVRAVFGSERMMPSVDTARRVLYEF